MDKRIETAPSEPWHSERGYGVPRDAADHCPRGDECAFEAGQNAWCPGCLPKPPEESDCGHLRDGGVCIECAVPSVESKSRRGGLMTSPQEADPKLDELREEYDRHRANCLRSGGTVRYKLAEAAWRETVAYIERRERARWEAAVRNALPFLNETMTVVDTKSGAAVRYPLDAATAAVDTLRALLQPEQGGE